MDPNPLTLYQLNTRIKELIKENLQSFWVVAEISELNINYSGHCYLELLQKDDNQENIVARARATIWNRSFRMIKPYFESTTGQVLDRGLKIMIRVSVEFHEVYGLSLNVIDIEPTYTVGEVAIRKQKIIRKLEDEGVVNMNKEIELPFLIQKIAVISSTTAAGLEDFIHQLTNNAYHFIFYYKVFPAIMQGNEAEGSIIQALEKVYHYEDFFDVVVLIRGGGSQTDLDCFNNYWLAYHITQFPIPVLTGIGHEQDESVADMVAHTRLKTPTAVAEYLIDQIHEVYIALTETEENILNRVKDLIKENSSNLERLSDRFVRSVKESIYHNTLGLRNFITRYISGSKRNIELKRRILVKVYIQLSNANNNYFRRHSEQLKFLLKDLISIVRISLSDKKHKLELVIKKKDFLDPLNILKRGYSITTCDKDIVKDGNQLEAGDEIETRFYKGRRKSIVR